MQCTDGGGGWFPEGAWPAGGYLRLTGLGADEHLRRAAGRLADAAPAQWRATAARAFADRLAEVTGAVHGLAGEVLVAEQRVAELEAELAAAHAALDVVRPWWAAR